MTKSILVVDDDPLIRQIVISGFAANGKYEVLAAKDGVEGIDIAREKLPDIIICDVQMPEMDGFSVLQQLQLDLKTANIPFIFLTGQSSRRSTRLGMELGADDYIAKPFSIVELMAAVESRLSKRAAIQTGYEEKLDVLRGNILTALPHELRTPLSFIIGYSDILAREADTLPPKSIEMMASGIRDSGYRLHHLIENYIIYAQIELISTEPERIARMRLLREAAPDMIVQDVVDAKLTKYGRSAQLNLSAGNDLLPMSKTNFEKMVEELVDNAFKFSSSETAVSITTAVKDDQFILAIRNEGQEITAEQIRNIGGYMQFGRRIYEQQGSGMGLIIAKRLAELYGGNLSIEPTMNGITTVCVALPN